MKSLLLSYIQCCSKSPKLFRFLIYCASSLPALSREVCKFPFVLKVLKLNYDRLFWGSIHPLFWVLVVSFDLEVLAVQEHFWNYAINHFIPLLALFSLEFYIGIDPLGLTLFFPFISLCFLFFVGDFCNFTFQSLFCYQDFNFQSSFSLNFHF